MEEDFEVISAYSREQAIEDGVLVDMDVATFDAGETGKRMRESLGIRLPIVMTNSLFGQISVNEKDEECGQSLSGRFWDVLNVFRFVALRNKNQSQINFDIRIYRGVKHKAESLGIKACVGPNDDGSPALTFMLPCED